MKLYNKRLFFTSIICEKLISVYVFHHCLNIKKQYSAKNNIRNLKPFKAYPFQYRFNKRYMQNAVHCSRNTEIPINIQFAITTLDSSIFNPMVLHLKYIPMSKEI